jgi:hypothetical protein
LFNDKHIDNDLGTKLAKLKFAKGFKRAIIQIGSNTLDWKHNTKIHWISNLRNM